MSNTKLTTRSINNCRFGFLTSDGQSALFDTVPADFAPQWLDTAPNAKILILCSDNPYPKCVEYFLKAHPDGKVYAPPYTAHVLTSILGGDFHCTWVRDNTKIFVGPCKISFTTVTQPGRGAYLVADTGIGGTYSGIDVRTETPVAVYDRPTVAIVYVSGCDFTEVIAEKIKEGTTAAQGLETVLIDLAALDTEKAIAALKNCNGILIGTPSVDNDADKKIWDLISTMRSADFSGRPAAVFGTYKDRLDAISNAAERLQQLKLALIKDNFAVQYCPEEAQLAAAYEYGYDIGCIMQNKPNPHRSKLVKCLVCGEIFDASLGHCPVCNVGMDQCVPVEEEPIGHAADTERTYIIAGGGTAGVSAAEAIRKRDSTGKIIIISSEPHLPINRPMLSKNIAVAAQSEESILLKSRQWYEENNIEIYVNTAVNAIDPKRKNVSLRNGKAIGYDRLIYAMGAECFIPNIPGKDLDGTIAIRSLKDLHLLWGKLPKAKTAVVIGGGVLGLEAAYELKKMRLSVTVLEAAPRLMARQIDSATSDAVAAAAQECGINVITNAAVSRINGRTKVHSVQLDNGSVYAADIVIISCGSKAVTAVAENVGIECRRAIVVNNRMETSIPNIYACGDCAEFDGMNYQLWAEASEQGRIAGANAADDPVAYTPVPYGTSMEAFGTRLFAIGDVGLGGKEYKTTEHYNELENTRSKYWFVDGKLCGGILFGSTDNTQILTDGVTEQKSYRQLKDLL